MSSLSRSWPLLCGLWSVIGSNHSPFPASGDIARPLRVCADPNNLPFSNAKRQGFENALASLIARDLGDTLEYYWWPQRRAWVRHTIGEGKCDVAIGVPTAFALLTTTRPYYRSTRSEERRVGKECRSRWSPYH